jgi:hypothetical protein
MTKIVDRLPEGEIRQIRKVLKTKKDRHHQTITLEYRSTGWAIAGAGLRYEQYETWASYCPDHDGIRWGKTYRSIEEAEAAFASVE